MPRNNNSSRNKSNNSNKQALEQMKYEIANEFGVNLGANATSRDNGSVGGEITKRLVQNGMNKISNNNSENY